jgi:hypothetical protein
MQVERIWHDFCVFWEGRQYHVFELNRMVGQATYEIVMELGQKVLLVLQNQQYNPHSASVKGINRVCHLLPLNHVLLQETETTNKQVFEDEPSLILVRVNPLNEVRHEHSVRNYFEPSEGKCWVLVRAQFAHHVCHIEEDLSLCLLIKTIANVYRSQNIHNHAEVWLLIEAIGLNTRLSL